MAGVALAGYYGFNNLGDEAILISIVQSLRALEPGLEITVLSHDPRATEKELPVKAVNRWCLREVAGALKKADLLICGGGSLFQDTTSARSLLYYLGVLELAHLLGRPSMLYAQGLGPLQRGWTRYLTGRVLDRVALITLRDTESHLLLQEIGVRRPEVKVTADPVLGLELQGFDLAAGRQKLESLGLMQQGRPVVGFSLRPWSLPPATQEALSQAADYLVDEGFEVVFLPFHFPRDVDASYQVRRLMQRPAVVVKEKLGLKETVGILSSLDLVVGMRLHALVLAAVLGVPFLGLSYDPKVEAFCRLVEQPWVALTALPVEDLSSILRRVIYELTSQKEKLKQVVEELKPLARHNAVLAIEVLLSGKRKVGG